MTTKSARCSQRSMMGTVIRFPGPLALQQLARRTLYGGDTACRTTIAGTLAVRR